MAGYHGYSMSNNDCIRTIKIDITSHLSDEDVSVIKDTIMDCTKVSELFTRLGLEHRSVSYMAMHKYGYEVAREMCPHLNTALLQQSAKVSLLNLKGWNQRNKKHKWEYKGAKHSASYPLNKLTLTRRGDQTTFSTNRNRIRIIHRIPEWFDRNYPEKTLQSGCISLKKRKVYLHLAYKIEPAICNGTVVVGVDRGLYNFVATSKGLLVPTKHLHAVERRYAYNKAELQSKGTRSAKRRLRALSGKEKRFRRDFDHCVSKALSEDGDVRCYVLEDLNGLRSSDKGKKMNRWLHKWSTFRFQTFLEYKCALKGIYIQYVNPKYTSQRCSMCGVIDKDARNRNRYRCKKCGHTEHADINASKNIRDRYLLSLEGKPGSIQPAVCDGSNNPVAIPHPCDGER